MYHIVHYVKTWRHHLHNASQLRKRSRRHVQKLLKHGRVISKICEKNVWQRAKQTNRHVHHGTSHPFQREVTVQKLTSSVLLDPRQVLDYIGVDVQYRRVGTAALSPAGKAMLPPFVALSTDEWTACQHAAEIRPGLLVPDTAHVVRQHWRVDGAKSTTFPCWNYLCHDLMNDHLCSPVYIHTHQHRLMTVETSATVTVILRFIVIVSLSMFSYISFYAACAFVICY